MGRSEAEASLRRRERKPSEGSHPCPANPAERRAGRAARTVWAALACFAALSVVACGGPDDPDSDPATDHPDSDAAAGGLDGPDVMLSAVTEPVYTVGEAVGEDWELLGRVASLSFDAAGSLYLFDAGAQRIVVVGPDGEFARFVGGPGEGPGEFDEASAMAVLPSGRIAVFEFGLPGTFAILEADGTFVESLSVDATKAAPAAKMLPLPDGRLISTGGPRITLASTPDQDQEGEAPPPGYRPMDVFPLDGADPGTFYHAWGPPPPKDSILVEVEAGMTINLPKRTALAPGLHWTVLSDGRIAIADSVGYRVKLVTPEGADAGRIERPIEPLAVTETVRDAVLAAARTEFAEMSSFGFTAASEMAMPPAMREAIERQIEEMTFPDGIPVVAGLAADREGRLWIERSSQDGVEDGPIDIVTPDGGYVGTLGPDGPRLPNAFGPAGLMAYLVEDDLGVQTIRVIRLTSLDR